MAKNFTICVLSVMFLAFTSTAFAVDNRSRPGRHFFHPRLRPAAIIVEPRIITVWITNGNGSTTEVWLTALTTGGYTGPRGERYQLIPTCDQLRLIYAH